MTGRERRTVGILIEWAVAPEPPLPAVAQTDAVAAFARSLALGPRPQRLALRVVLAALELLPLLAGQGGRLSRLSGDRQVGFLAGLERGPVAPLGDALAALAHLSYYGDLAVPAPARVRPRRSASAGPGAADRRGPLVTAARLSTEARW